MLVIDAATRHSFSAMTEENLEELLADPAVSVRPYACSIIIQILNERAQSTESSRPIIEPTPALRPPDYPPPPPLPRRKTARRLFCFECLS